MWVFRSFGTELVVKSIERQGRGPMPFTMMPPATTVLISSLLLLRCICLDAAPAAAGGGGLVVDFDLRWWITTDLE